MGRVVDIDESEPHKVSEVICVHCGKRWLSVRNEKVLLIDIQCPECTNQGYVIETGQTLSE